MADVEQNFEVLENRLMRAWVHRDTSDLKSLISGDGILMFGIKPPVLLDRASFVSAVQHDFLCKGFRFHEVTARKYGKSVWFSGHVELELKLADKEWAGNFLVTDLWRKGAIRRRWMLAERSLSPVEPNSGLSDAIRAMQLWR
ncbi:MAG: nuclear transport factor 2 family protein [Erythrobacter sp.]